MNVCSFILALIALPIAVAALVIAIVALCYAVKHKNN